MTVRVWWWLAWAVAVSALWSGAEPWAFLGGLGLAALGLNTALRALRMAGEFLAWHNRGRTR